MLRTIVLAVDLAQLAMPGLQRVKDTFVMLGLWKDRLVAVRRGNPLSIGATRCGTYLASMPQALPGTVKRAGDDCVLEFKF